jgi:hypothetical protein
MFSTQLSKQFWIPPQTREHFDSKGIDTITSIKQQWPAT